MNEDRRKILEMLVTGKITADEADALLAALERSASDPAGPATSAAPKRKPKYLRILVEDEGHKGPTKVNVRIPMQLLRAGVKLTSLIPAEARERVNAHLQREGVPFNISQITSDNLEEVVEQLDDLTVDVNEARTKVRVYCE